MEEKKFRFLHIFGYMLDHNKQILQYLFIKKTVKICQLENQINTYFSHFGIVLNHLAKFSQKKKGCEARPTSPLPFPPSSCYKQLIIELGSWVRAYFLLLKFLKMKNLEIKNWEVKWLWRLFNHHKWEIVRFLHLVLSMYPKPYKDG